MSGLEIGLALVPLIGSGAKHYRDILKPFSRFRNHGSTFANFQLKLETQRTLYDREIRRLLTNIFGKSLADDMYCECPQRSA